MPSSTAENYLKCIYLEREQAAAPGPLAMGRLAAAMRVAPGTATAMARSLADSGLVDYAPRGGVRLTRQGEQAALQVVRRHRLIELFLVEHLGMDWSEVHAEAERLEHAISDRLLRRIDRALGGPRFDPHGDPIPPQRGRPPEAAAQSLAACAAGALVCVGRIADQEPAFLQFVEHCGLRPGARLTVVESSGPADAVRVRPEGGHEVALGRAAAAKIMVHPSAPSARRAAAPRMHAPVSTRAEEAP